MKALKEYNQPTSSVLSIIVHYKKLWQYYFCDLSRYTFMNFNSLIAQVKLQILNLAMKLCLTNPKQTKLLSQYVFNLAKYDTNYDIRDR